MKDTPKSRRTRARILAAATRLFAQIGYHAAANALIAEAAGITRGAMLYHFPSREEAVLYAALLAKRVQADGVEALRQEARLGYGEG